MKVYCKNSKKEITINEKTDFLAAGGEGTIYQTGDICYKITFNPFNETKLLELMNLKHSSIIVPIDLITKKNNNSLLGYSLPYVVGESLCRMFNTSFWNDNNIVSKDIGDLVIKMIEAIQYAHDREYLLVDWNEMNFMVSKDFKMPYFIDTNAWKTPHFPPDAVTPLFKDPTTNDFTKLTDWYGFAILICKLYLGIHPFKGSHSSYGRGYDDTIKRMVNGISIFNKDVKLPTATRNFDVLPDNYKEWFINIFEKNKRIPPPNVVGYVTIADKHKITDLNKFKIDLFKLVNKPIKRYYIVNGEEVIFCDDSILIGQNSYPNIPKAGVIISPREKNPFFVFIHNDKLCIMDKTNKYVPLDIFSESFIAEENIIYSKNKSQITQIVCSDINTKSIFSVGMQTSVMPKATKVYGNCFYMSVIGNTYFLVPSKNHLYSIRIPELDGYNIVEAKFDKSTLGVIREKKGKYDRIFCLLDDNAVTYTMREESDIQVPLLNFVVLDNGINVAMDENGSISIFNKKGSKVINDDSIKTTFKLFKNGINVLFSQNGKMYSIKSN